MILAFALATALAQNPTGNPSPSPRAWRDDQGWRVWRSTGRTGAGYAFFEFAPASGAGMGAACACTTPTGAKGEAMTFTRTGDATCSKQGLSTTGIVNGDLVVCTANQPRVESSGGVLGLRVEGARTNETLRSAAIENVVWAAGSAGVAAPVITADFAVAPDGTTTADRLQLPACPTAGIDYSGINQTSGTIASPSSSSVFLKANAGTPSVSICMFGIATGTRACTQFTLNTSTWTRAIVPNVTNTGGMNLEIACENRTGSYSGATNTGAADILVWGAQSEAGAYATSYIPTVAAAVTRNAESPYLTVAAMTAGTYSTAANFETTFNVTASAARVATLYQSAGVFTDDFFSTNFRAFLFDGVVSDITSATAVTTSGRVGSYYDLTSLGVCVSGICTTTAAARTINNITRVRIGVDGSSGSTGYLNGIITRVCVDPSSSRCR